VQEPDEGQHAARHEDRLNDHPHSSSQAGPMPRLPLPQIL
jgi:hypothetical protein